MLIAGGVSELVSMGVCPRLFQSTRVHCVQQFLCFSEGGSTSFILSPSRTLPLSGLRVRDICSGRWSPLCGITPSCSGCC
uniref:Uncharacterized protein n=2 Tax=Anguilla anguilla TaxID=7936 RepID=A0A0E9Q4Z8_ANGAN